MLFYYNLQKLNDQTLNNLLEAWINSNIDYSNIFEQFVINSIISCRFVCRSNLMINCIVRRANFSNFKLPLNLLFCPLFCPLFFFATDSPFYAHFPINKNLLCINSIPVHTMGKAKSTWGWCLKNNFELFSFLPNILGTLESNYFIGGF